MDTNSCVRTVAQLQGALDKEAVYNAGCKNALHEIWEILGVDNQDDARRALSSVAERTEGEAVWWLVESKHGEVILAAKTKAEAKKADGGLWDGDKLYPVFAHPSPGVDALAQEIRRVDGSNSLGAGALAEALMPFLRSALIPSPSAPVVGEEIADAVLDWMVRRQLLDADNEYRASDVLAVLNDLLPVATAPSVGEITEDMLDRALDAYGQISPGLASKQAMRAALTTASYRLVGPGEVDAETVERCAAEADGWAKASKEVADRENNADRSALSHRRQSQMDELASTYARILIENLLHVHALANLYRATGDEEHRAAAATWLPNLESQMASLKRELTKAKP